LQQLPQLPQEVNHLNLSRIEQKVIDVCKKGEYPLPPREIAEIIEEKASTVRGLCRRLVKKGLLYQPIPGHYDYLSPYGDERVSALMVHDLRLSTPVESLKTVVKRPDHEYVLEGIKIEYQFGKRNGKFSASVSDARGIGYTKLIQILDRIEDDAERYFGKELEYNCSYHLHRDLGYLRLDGFQSITIGVLKGCFKRIYQKEDVVRVEVGIKDATQEEMTDLVVSNFNQLSFFFSIRKSIQNIEKTVKEINRKVSDTQRAVNHLLKGSGGSQ